MPSSSSSESTRVCCVPYAVGREDSAMAIAQHRAFANGSLYSVRKGQGSLGKSIARTRERAPNAPQAYRYF